MYLSAETVSILKNLSTINQSILIKPGKELNSMSVMKNILVKADIQEEFEKVVAIYDLNQFLNCLSLIPGAQLDLGDSSITISDCLLYTSPSPRDSDSSRMPSSA